MKITATQLRRIIREEARRAGGGTAPVSAFYAAGPAEQADLKAKIADLATSSDFKGALSAARLPPTFSRLKQSEFQALWKNIDYPGYTRAAAYRKIPAVTEETLRQLVRSIVNEATDNRAYVVAVFDTGHDIEKVVFMLDPRDKNPSKRPEQFSADYAARTGMTLLDVFVTPVSAASIDAGRGIEADYGNEYASGDPPNPKLAKFSPVAGGWNPDSAPRSSDRGY